MTTKKLQPGMLVLYVIGPISIGPHLLIRRLFEREKNFPTTKYDEECWEYVSSSGKVRHYFFRLNCIRVVESEEDLVI